MPPVNVMVTADDFGVNKPRTDGILLGVKEGFVSHCSLLVNGSYVEAAVTDFLSTVLGHRHMCSRRSACHATIDLSMDRNKDSYDPSEEECISSSTMEQPLGVMMRIEECTIIGQHHCNTNKDHSSQLNSHFPFYSLILPRCSIGLHLNLTEGLALSQEMKQCQWLCNTTTGEMLGKVKVITTLSSIINMPDIVDGHIVYSNGSDMREKTIIQAVMVEINAQIREFVKLLSRASKEYLHSTEHDDYGCKEYDYLKLTWNTGGTAAEVFRRLSTLKNGSVKDDDVCVGSRMSNEIKSTKAHKQYREETVLPFDTNTNTHNNNSNNNNNTHDNVVSTCSPSLLCNFSICSESVSPPSHTTATTPNECDEKDIGIWLDGHHHIHVIPIVFHLLSLLSLHGGVTTDLETNGAGEMTPSTKGLLETIPSNVTVSDVCNRVIVNGIRLPQDHGLFLGSSSSSITSYDNIVSTIAGDRCEALTTDYILGGSHMFLDDADCFGRPFWAKVALLGFRAREKIRVLWSEVSHYSLAPFPMVTTDGFIGLDTMGVDCRPETVLDKIGYYQHQCAKGVPVRDSKAVVNRTEDSLLFSMCGLVNSGEHDNNNNNNAPTMYSTYNNNNNNNNNNICVCGCTTINVMA